MCKEELFTVNKLNLFSGIFMNKLCNQFGNKIWLLNMRKMPAFGYWTNNCIWQLTVQPLHCIFQLMRSYSICNNIYYICFNSKDKRQQSHSHSISILFQLLSFKGFVSLFCQPNSISIQVSFFRITITLTTPSL